MAEPETGEKPEGGEPNAAPAPEPKVELPPPIPPPKIVLDPALLAACVSQVGKTFDGLSYAYMQLVAEVITML